MNNIIKEVNDFWKKVTGDKKEWRKMEARAKALPKDYRVVYDEIKNYMFKFSAGGGMDMVAILKDLLELFEEGAANGKGALEITGNDVATFCDELLRNTKTYTESWREKLNSHVMKKLGNEKKK
jgi:DNA-binding ferritin-like protein (Dps family)